MRIGVAAMLVAVAVAAGGCQAASGEVFQHSFNHPLVLGGDPIGQTFRPATSEVAGVDVLIATFGERVDGDGELRVRLRDGARGRVLASETLAGSALADNEWAPVRFASPVPAPQVAAVELSWHGAGTVAVWANTPPTGEDDGLLNDPYLGGQLLVDGEPAVGDLAFRVVGTGGPGDAARNLAGIVRQGAGRLARDPLFAVAWLLLLGGAVWLGVRGLRSAADELGDGGRREQPREHEEARS